MTGMTEVSVSGLYNTYNTMENEHTRHRSSKTQTCSTPSSRRCFRSIRGTGKRFTLYLVFWPRQVFRPVPQTSPIRATIMWFDTTLTPS